MVYGDRGYRGCEGVIVCDSWEMRAKGQVYSLGDNLYISKKLFESYVERLKAIGKEFSIREAKGGPWPHKKVFNTLA